MQIYVRDQVTKNALIRYSTLAAQVHHAYALMAEYFQRLAPKNHMNEELDQKVKEVFRPIRKVIAKTI